MTQLAIDTPEFRLLTSCCRWNFACTELARPRVGDGLDWGSVVALARRHRVQGLVWNALAPHADQLPDSASEALSSDARSISATNLGLSAECRGLKDDFDRCGIPLLFVKGLVVAALAYHAPMLKMGWDIDVLIDPRDLRPTADVLLQRGYAPCEPRRGAQLAAWHRRSKESEWVRDGRYVELHTRLADNPGLISGINVHSPRQAVKIGRDGSLPTLAEDEQFAYLAVHGASSAWFRLKWISDFAALIAGKDGGEIERLYCRSQELDAGRAAGQALLLADRLFDALSATPRLRAELSSDRSTRLLCDAAVQMLSGTAEPTERPLGTLPIHWTQFLLKPGIAFKISELRWQAVSLFNRPEP